MKLSFIVPAHNAARYIVRAVQSIFDCIRDTVPFEILIVENGSGDDTERLSTELTERHAEVRLLHSGTSLAKARNVGIRNADGDWIVFVDADDLCEPGMADAVPLLSEYAPDLMVCGFRKGKQVIHNRYKVRDALISGGDLEPARAWMISSPTHRLAAWAKLYNRDFLLSNSLYFDETLARSEDSDFLFRVLNACGAMLISDLIVYRYSQSPSSMMRSVSRGIAPLYLESIRKSEQAAIGGSPGVREAYPDFVYAMILIVAVHEFYDSAVRMPWSARCRDMALFLKEGPVERALSRMIPGHLKRPRNWPVFFFRCRLFSLGGAVCFLRSVYNRRLWEEEAREEG